MTLQRDVRRLRSREKEGGPIADRALEICRLMEKRGTEILRTAEWYLDASVGDKFRMRDQALQIVGRALKRELEVAA